MNPSGAVSYSYSSGSPVVSPTTTNIYSITGSDASGCVSAPLTVSVTVNPLPSVTIASSHSVLCVGQTATLIVSGANTYTWSTSAFSSQIIVSPTTSTTYSVIGYDLNNCPNTASFTQNVSACTNISEAAYSYNTLRIYPNPTNGLCVIECSGYPTVEIYDLVGNLVFIKKMEHERLELDLSELKAGIYFISVLSQPTTKIIKTD
jgi:hypothetical protein